MAQTDEEFLRKLQSAFRLEAQEHLQSISSGLMELEKAEDAGKRREGIAAIFRAAHSLKGAARAVSSVEIESICQSLESVFATWKRHDFQRTPEVFDPLHEGINVIERLLPGVGGTQTVLRPNELTTLLTNLSSRETVNPAADSWDSKPSASNQEIISSERQSLPDSPPPVTPPAKQVVQTPAEPSTSGKIKEADVQPSSPQRPAPAKEGLPETLRISTAKLDALLLQAEELLAVKLTENQRAADLKMLLSELERWEDDAAKVAPEVRTVAQYMELNRPTGTIEEPGATPLPLTGLGKLSEFFERNQISVRAVRARLAVLVTEADHDRRATGGMVDALLEDSKKLLMLPSSTLFAMFPKLVRDLSRDQGKDVELIVQGGDIEIDKRILGEMKDPLIHLLRNSVDHGIETPQERTQAGKPARGNITVAVAQLDGNKVEIQISDDGAGIDAQSVRKAAVRHGVISEEEAAALGEQESLRLIFRSDVSTSPIITEISGRGLGMAIVEEKVEGLGGRIQLETAKGRGTSFRLLLPLTLATFRGILVRAADQLFVIPTASVERVARVKSDQIKTVENRETVCFDGSVISLVRLSDVLALPRPQGAPTAAFLPLVVLGTGEKRIGFQVDAVLNEQEVLVKQLRKPLARVRNIAGATVMGSGKAIPILNVSDLMKSAAKLSPSAAASGAGAGAEGSGSAQKSVLVVEDSITARMLLKSILESAGHRVRTAVDGMEALTILKTEDFDLVVSDVEMPRMNGLDLTAKIRADKRLAEVPVVLVTALASQEDKERGIDVGADAYIVKSSFDQSSLLEVVQRLL